MAYREALDGEAPSSVMTRARQHGWVLYDASCGFCTRWVPFWRHTLRAAGLDFAGLQEPWVSTRMSFSEGDRLRDLLILFEDGTLVRGADVYRCVARQFWWSYPVYLFAVMPGGAHMFDWGYRVFALHRYRFSAACGLVTRVPHLTPGPPNLTRSNSL